VTLTDAGDGGTNIHWQSRFDVRFRGTDALMRAILAKVLRDISKQLAVAAERRPSR
jgi:hypothetical protein